MKRIIKTAALAGAIYFAFSSGYYVGCAEGKILAGLVDDEYNFADEVKATFNLA